MPLITFLSVFTSHTCYFVRDLCIFFLIFLYTVYEAYGGPGVGRSHLNEVSHAVNTNRMFKLSKRH